MEQNHCDFCKIVQHQLEANIIYRDDYVCCFLDIDPINNGHLLIVPNEHINDIDQLDDETFHHLMNLVRKLTTLLKNIYQPDGYTIMQNGGAFADYGHFHMHIFPRYKADEFGWTCKELENPQELRMVKELLLSKLNDSKLL